MASSFASQTFADLPRTVMREFTLRMRRACYPCGTVLYRAGEAPRHLLFLYDGIVLLHGTSVEGQSVLMRIVPAGQVLGLSAVVTNRRYVETATAATPCEVGSLACRDFLAVQAGHTELLEWAVEELATDRDAALQETGQLATARSVQAKLAYLLLSIARKSRGRPLPLTQQDIADSIGASRESVNRALSPLIKAGIVSMHNGYLTVRPPGRPRGTVSQIA